MFNVLCKNRCKYIEHNCQKAKELCDLTYRKASDGSIVINIDPIEGNYDDDLNIDLANQSLFVFISDRGGYSKIRLPRVAERMNMDDVAKLICTNDKFNDFLRKLKRSRMNESGSRYYESLSSSDAERIMDNLREQNSPNTLDSENFRMATALNLFQELLNERDKGYPYNSDLGVLRKFKKAGYSEARDLISDIAGAINRRIKELTQIKNELEELKHIAISFDIMSGH